ncbi:MAG: replicative DNA helicase [Arcanobacterium sp.]
MSHSQFERTPPNDLDAERSVLGGMMLSKDALADVSEILDRDDFYRPAHAEIFSTILSLFAGGQPADAVTVAAELQRQGILDQVGGRTLLYDLVSAVPTAANAGYYATIVRDQAMLRRLVETGTRIAQLGYTTDGGDVNELLNTAQAEVYAMTDNKMSTNYAPLEEIMPDLREELQANAARGDELAGLETGFPDIDKVLLGLRPNQMIIIAARPGMGKTTLAMDFCRHIAIKKNQPVAFFSLEMNRTELAMRILSSESEVWLSKLIKGELEQRDWDRVGRTMDRIASAPLFVDDSPNLTMMEIRSKARRLRQHHKIELIVIDYLQLLTSGGRTPESRQQEVSDFSRSIKLLAKELEIPIIAISQLNRETERRETKKPQVSDLRESGSLEQDADVVMLIHRSSERDEMGAPPPAKIIVGKNRSGPTSDDIELEFQGSLVRFANYATPEVDYREVEY